MKRFSALAGVVVGFWLLLFVLVLFEVFPYRPNTLIGWVVLLVVGPPAYVLLSTLGDAVVVLLHSLGVAVFPRRAGVRSSSKPFSWARIGVAALAMTVILVVTLYFFWRLGIATNAMP